MGGGREFRVTWRRQGLRRHHRLYQSGPAAQRWAIILQGRMWEITDVDPADFACCSGRECGCRGITNAESWAEQSKDVPPLIEGPTISTREVGAWEATP